MKKVFVHPFSKWLYRWLHPDLGMRLAQYLSVKNKLISGAEDVVYLGEDKEWLILYTKEKAKTMAVDYFIFGHRHIPLNIDLGNNSKYINLGEWIHSNTYACFDGKELSLLTFNENEKA
jgi:UDP-2,3-diacylglucosamine hydrolase